MARRRPPRRRRKAQDEPDWIEELDGEEEPFYEDDEEDYTPASQGVPVTTILVMVAIGLALIFAVVVFKKATGTAVEKEKEDVEPYIVRALSAFAQAQDVFWRDMGRKYAQSSMSLYYDYEKRAGVPPAVLSPRIARASSPDKAYRGYYFVTIAYAADGKKVNPKKSWAFAAVPAVDDAHHVLTYIVNKDKVVYGRDMRGQAPREWPKREDLNVEGGWVQR